jgi:hypothetical protein
LSGYEQTFLFIRATQRERSGGQYFVGCFRDDSNCQIPDHQNGTLDFRARICWYPSTRVSQSDFQSYPTKQHFGPTSVQFNEVGCTVLSRVSDTRCGTCDLTCQIAKRVLSQLSYTPPVSVILLISIPVAGVFRRPTKSLGFGTLGTTSFGKTEP